MSVPFADLIEALPTDPELEEGERVILRQLSVQGGPLWKIVKSSLDYANHMRDHIAASDLSTEEGTRQARQLQLKRDAALNFLRWFVQCYAPPGPGATVKGNDNG